MLLTIGPAPRTGPTQVRKPELIGQVSPAAVLGGRRLLEAEVTPHEMFARIRCPFRRRELTGSDLRSHPWIAWPPEVPARKGGRWYFAESGHAVTATARSE